MNIARCPEPTDNAGWPDSRSLLRKHLTPQVWQSLKDLQTSSGVTLKDCIASGLAHSDSAIGIYAGDAESVERFGLLFAPVIQEWHGCARACGVPVAEQMPELPNLHNPDPEGAFIRSARIRVVRNLQGYRLMPTISPAELLEVQRLVGTAVGAWEQDLSGSYRALNDWHGDALASGAARRAGFDGTDRFQQAAGICRDWPQGRGVFSNHDATLQVWVNEEDHLRVISMQANADLGAVYARLQQACRHLEQSLRFAQSERYGYLASCPSNLGTGLRASFHIHLPLSGGSPEFRELCASHGIGVRSIAGEIGRQRGAVYDISNQRRLGLSPLQCMQQLLDGTAKIIALEKQKSRPETAF